MKSKKEMMRVLKTSDEEFVLDVTGKKNGRGAYLCLKQECFHKAVKGRGLERSFKQTIKPQIYENLKKEMKIFEAE